MTGSAWYILNELINMKTILYIFIFQFFNSNDVCIRAQSYKVSLLNKRFSSLLRRQNRRGDRFCAFVATTLFRNTEHNLLSPCLNLTQETVANAAEILIKDEVLCFNILVVTVLWLSVRVSVKVGWVGRSALPCSSRVVCWHRSSTAGHSYGLTVFPYPRGP